MLFYLKTQSVYVGSKAQNIRVESTRPSHFAHKRVVLTIESSLPKKLATPKKPANFSIFLKIILNPCIMMPAKVVH
jgi:hypothetical protein